MAADGYIKSFVIGSSIFVFMHFYLSVQKGDPKKMNYTFEQYSIVAPLYLGFMNMASLFLGKTYELSLRTRLFYMSIMSPLFVFCISYFSGTYNFTKKEWIRYGAWILLKHMFTYNVLIYLLEVSL